MEGVSELKICQNGMIRLVNGLHIDRRECEGRSGVILCFNENGGVKV